MTRTRSLLPALLVAAVLPLATACEVEASDCTPTSTSAADAAKVDLAGPARSSTIEARVTADGSGLDGVPVRFELLDDGSTLTFLTVDTGADGTAQADFKNHVGANEVTGLARADAVRATYGGGATYCSSSDEASFSTVGGPVTVP